MFGFSVELASNGHRQEGEKVAKLMVTIYLLCPVSSEINSFLQRIWCEIRHKNGSHGLTEIEDFPTEQKFLNALAKTLGGDSFSAISEIQTGEIPPGGRGQYFTFEI